MGGEARKGGFLKVIPTVSDEFVQEGKWAVSGGKADF
jgi:hypothetical protein